MKTRTSSKVFIDIPTNGIERIKTHKDELTFIPVMLAPEVSPDEHHIQVWFKDKHPKTFDAILKEVLLGNYIKTEKGVMRLTEYYLQGTFVNIIEVSLSK